MSNTLTATRPSTRTAPVQNPSLKPQRPPQPYVVHKYKKSEELKRHNRRLTRAVIITFSFIAIMLIRQLVLIGTASNAYEISALSNELKEISRTAASLKEQSQIYNSPQNLDNLARSIGMVPSGSVPFLRLSDGAIIGQSNVSTRDNIGSYSIDNYALDSLNAMMADHENRKPNKVNSQDKIIVFTNPIPAPNTR